MPQATPRERVKDGKKKKEEEMCASAGGQNMKPARRVERRTSSLLVTHYTAKPYRLMQSQILSTRTYPIRSSSSS